MKLLSLIPPKLNNEDIEKWKARIQDSEPVLNLIRQVLNKKIAGIENRCADVDKLEVMSHAILVGLLRTKKDLQELLTLLEV